MTELRVPEYAVDGDSEQEDGEQREAEAAAEAALAASLFGVCPIDLLPIKMGDWRLVNML